MYISFLDPNNYKDAETYYKALGQEVAYECEYCGTVYNSKDIPNFCKNCGAKMDYVVKRVRHISC
jgi:rubrerythrin